MGSYASLDWPPRRRPHAGAPPHLARQIEVAARLAPAEAYLGHVAVLLCCGPAPEADHAEGALRDFWPVDAVRRLHLPLGCWSEALAVPEGAEPWLRHHVMREIDRHEASVLAVLDTPHGSQAAGRRFVSLLQRWGVQAPVALLRPEPGGEVCWLELEGGSGGSAT